MVDPITNTPDLEFPNDEGEIVLKARLIGYQDGLKVFAPLCKPFTEIEPGSGSGSGSGSGGSTTETEWQTNDRDTWAAREAGYLDGKKVMAFATECCEYPCHPDGPVPGQYDCDEPMFVEKDCWPPYGISKHLLLRIEDSPACGEAHCHEFMAKFDGSKWRWGFADIVMDMSLSCDSYQSGFNFDFSYSPCAANLISEPEVVSRFPLVLKFTIIAPGCCCCPGDNAMGFIVKVLGFCERRHAAREVDYKDGKKVFAKAECCPDFDCPPRNCCASNPCPLVLCMTNLGDCNCFGTCVTLLPGGITPGIDDLTPCDTGRWTNHSFSTCDPAHEGGAGICCIFDSTGQAYMRLVLDCAPNCHGSGFATIPCTADFFDFEMEITVHCVTCDPDPFHPNCCPCGDYQILVRISREPC